MNIQDNDFKWFLDNYDKIFQEYGHVFVAIKNCQILGTYSNIIDAIKETSLSEELGTFIVQECNGNESGYTNYIASWQFR